MRQFLAVLAALLLGAPVAAQEAPEWVGVWQGRVGTYPVRLCIDVPGDGPARGSYYYLAHLEPIDLGQADGEGGWIEFTPEDETAALWELAELSGARLRGTWRQGRRSLPFSLTPIAWRESGLYLDGPCTSAAFMQPRLGGGRIVNEPGRIAGLAYTVHRYLPAGHFADDVAAQNFSFEPEQPGDAAIVEQIATLVPMPGDAVDDDVWQCIAYGIAANGTDGSFEQSVEPRMAAGPYLTVELRSGTYCGGAHPDYYGGHLTYDRTTGEEVNVDDWIGTPNDDGAVAVPAELRELVIDRWPTDPDLAECRDVAAGETYWAIELRRTGLTFTPSFPHALQGCEVPVAVEWPDLMPFLDAEGRAGLARLRAE